VWLVRSANAIRHIYVIRKELILDYSVYTGQGLTEAKTSSLAMLTSITYLIHAIARCFIISFFEKETIYTQQMMRLKVSTYVYTTPSR
jgi:hypothetical protein